MTFKTSALVAAALLATLASAHAATVTRTVTFSATGFSSNPIPGPIPADPVTGSFDITLDNTQNYSNQTAGITLDSLNIALGSALSFNYLPANDQLVVGGLDSGACCTNVIPAGDDFALYINGFLFGTPTLAQFFYTQTAAGNRFFLSHTGTVSVSEPNVGATPLPGALPLFAAGLGALGLMASRRKRKAAAALCG
jgi:hypothetical protein